MIQWFPGHMAKTRRLITENLKLVDVVIEIVDARLPLSSRNPLIDEIVGDKPRVMLLNKADLADEQLTRLWTQYYSDQGLVVLPFNALQGASRSAKKQLLEAIQSQAQNLLEKRKNKGIINKTIRMMIVGIPNVGKSTLINFLVGKGAAETADRPGVTRGKQWIRLEKDLELLDTPGILWPKFEDPQVGFKLAATGAISENAYDPVELSLQLLNWLRLHAPGRVETRYKITENEDVFLMLTDICKRRGFLRPGGVPDLEKGAIMLLDEFRAGKLGQVTLDQEPQK